MIISCFIYWRNHWSYFCLPVHVYKCKVFKQIQCTDLRAVCPSKVAMWSVNFCVLTWFWILCKFRRFSPLCTSFFVMVVWYDIWILCKCLNNKQKWNYLNKIWITELEMQKDFFHYKSKKQYHNLNMRNISKNLM